MKFSLIVILGAAIVAALNSANKPAEQPMSANAPSRLGVTTNNQQLTTNLPAEALAKEGNNPRTKHFRLDKNRLAIDGYDPVSYFKTGSPKKGSASQAYDYDGVIYWFANAENLAEFKKNPAKYEPVWGGWCGHAMALRGEKVEINPECYKIVNGRNVLFFKTFYANALTNWEKEIKTTPENTLMTMGDDFWGKTLAK